MSDIKDKVARFLKDNPSPSDQRFHEWAQGQGLDVHRAEAAAYQLASGRSRQRRPGDNLPGGLADGMDPGQFDQKQLQMGIEVQMQHTDDPQVARQIATDHLSQVPDYYTRLDQMQKQRKRELDRMTQLAGIDREPQGQRS